MKGWKDERMKVYKKVYTKEWKDRKVYMKVWKDIGRYIWKDERMIKNIYIKGWKSEWMKPHKQITEP